MAQPARPRPRPRVVSKQPAERTLNDEDDHFRKNKGRTAQQWRQLEQSAAKATPFTGSEDSWDVGGQEDGLLSKHRKKKPIKQNERPRWQDTDVSKMLSSDNEDAVQIIEHTPTDRQESASPGKRKRERSRSRSITPPPKLPIHQRVHAMNLVRQALDIRSRPPSPVFFPDDSVDTVELVPELAEIAAAVKQNVKHAPTEPERTGGPEVVTINVRWRPHPLDPSAREQCWTFNIKRHDTFRDVFDEVADLAGIMADQLVVSHDQRRVFASGTPHSLHLWAEGELEACDKQTSQYIRAQRSHRTASPAPRDGTPEGSLPAVPQSDLESETESTGGNTLKLVLRSAATKDKTFPLTVRSTTTCGAIVKAFLKAAGLPDSCASSTNRVGSKSVPSPHLVVDGDKMAAEAEIGEADLEDGDLVEIVGV